MASRTNYNIMHPDPWRYLVLPAIYLLIVLLCLVPADAQFVDISIEVPPHSDLIMINDTSGKTLPPALPPGTGICWLLISASENLQLSVTLSYMLQSGDGKHVPGLYLNNGTNKTDKAVLFTGNSAVFPVNDSGQLIKNMPGRPGTISAWIGIPCGLVKELIIEYH